MDDLNKALQPAFTHEDWTSDPSVARNGDIVFITRTNPIDGIKPWDYEIFINKKGELKRLTNKRGWAYFETKDYTRAEQDLHGAILDQKQLANFNAMRMHSPLLMALAHFYLGQVYEATGKREQAANEYQEFLSHFENSRATLPQIAMARAALQRSLP